MARQSRRKPTGVISTFFVELSALLGILGIAQPTIRNHLWHMVQPASVNSQLNQAPQRFDQYVSHPEPQLTSQAHLSAPEQQWSSYPSAQAAEATLPKDVRHRSAWNVSGYNPMGTYQ